jgi:hypothetical protein
LYTSCMLRGAFTLLIKFSTYLSKKKKNKGTIVGAYAEQPFYGGGPPSLSTPTRLTLT